MQYEFRGKTLQEAVGKSLGRDNLFSGKSFISNTHMTCDQIGSHIQRLQSEIEQSLDVVESLVQEVEDRTRALGNQARRAAIGLAVDVALIASGVGNMVTAIRAFRAISAARGAGKIAFGAIDLSRNLDTGLSRFDALKEWIDIRSVQGNVDRHMDRVVRHARAIDQLWERYETMACDRR